MHLTKKKLAAMPQAERELPLLLGHAANEMNVLSKLILMMRKDVKRGACQQAHLSCRDRTDFCDYERITWSSE